MNLTLFFLQKIFHTKSHRFDRRGQIVVEYVLLLTVLLALATLIINFTISRSPGNEGFIIQKWMGIVETISQDYPDSVDGQ